MRRRPRATPSRPRSDAARRAAPPEPSLRPGPAPWRLPGGRPSVNALHSPGAQRTGRSATTSRGPSMKPVFLLAPAALAVITAPTADAAFQKARPQALATTTDAQVDYFLKIDGIDGESTD